MLFTQIANRTARGMAVGALVLSLSATTFGGLANAARLADETQDCSDAAHARNDAVHLLHEAWKLFDGDLKDLARDVRKLQHEAHKSGTTLLTDAREEVSSARHDLKDIVSQAHEDIQDVADLGTACKEEIEETTTTTTTTTTGTAAPTDSTGGAGSVDTSGLEQKYKDIVDKAIAGMQLVVDGVTAAVLDVTAATESTDTSDDAKVKTELKTAKAEREKAKEHRDEARTEAKDKSNGKSDVNRSSNSGKGRDGEDRGRK
jgi:hypothetical protein